MSELRLNTDGHIIKLGADNDVSLTHVHNTGLLLNSTRQLQFNDASQNINAPSATVLDINATDEIELNATAVDLNGTLDVSGTLTQTGVATFAARDIHSSGITIANAGQIGSVGDADSMAIASDGVVTFTQAPVFPDGSLALADLDIDGGTDIGAAIVDADLFVIDDGAGGTNRKTTAARLKTYTSSASIFGAVGFTARLTTGANLDDATTTVIVFNDEIYDTNSAYNVSDGIFTVPVAGKYLFGVTLQFSDAQGNMSDMQAYLSINDNADDILRAESTSNATTFTKNSLTWTGIVAALSVNDTVKIKAAIDTNDSSGAAILHGDNKSIFWGVNIA